MTITPKLVKTFTSVGIPTTTSTRFAQLQSANHPPGNSLKFQRAKGEVKTSALFLEISKTSRKSLAEKGELLA